GSPLSAAPARPQEHNGGCFPFWRRAALLLLKTSAVGERPCTGISPTLLPLVGRSSFLSSNSIHPLWNRINGSPVFPYVDRTEQCTKQTGRAALVYHQDFVYNPVTDTAGSRRCAYTGGDRASQGDHSDRNLPFRPGRDRSRPQTRGATRGVRSCAG